MVLFRRKIKAITNHRGVIFFIIKHSGVWAIQKADKIIVLEAGALSKQVVIESCWSRMGAVRQCIGYWQDNKQRGMHNDF
jgi:hypothetical protein